MRGFTMMSAWTHRGSGAVAAVLAGAVVLAGCAGPSASGAGSGGAADLPTAAAPPPDTAPGAVHANLAGARCHGATCDCRNRHGNPAENPAPDEGHKRFEIRLAGEDGSAALESPTLGRFTAGSNEACFYIDVVPGTTHDVSFIARESHPEGGVGPLLSIAEYGPKGPWWYGIVEVHCAGPGGKCNRDAADAWGADIKRRKRGRLDPCGSTVITHLVWDTSGGTGSRELGIFQDFSVKFTMEVKKFATQFAPGSTECVPK
jgi:hypothetical protein